MIAWRTPRERVAARSGAHEAEGGPDLIDKVPEIGSHDALLHREAERELRQHDRTHFLFEPAAHCDRDAKP
jgi:hypothetical protein